MLPTPDVKGLDYDRVYEPAEDSFLLLDVLENERDYILGQTKSLSTNYIPIVCEIGTGSGIVTSFLQASIFPDNGAVFFATDINLYACESCLRTSLLNQKSDGHAPYLDVIRGNLGTPLRLGIVDLLVFNPPYVPSEDSDSLMENYPKEYLADDHDSRWLDLALVGGHDGMVITWKLLDSLDGLLSTNGIAYILFCRRNNPESVAKIMDGRGWITHKVIERKAGWEVISVWRFQKKKKNQN